MTMQDPVCLRIRDEFLNELEAPDEHNAAAIAFADHAGSCSNCCDWLETLEDQPILPGTDALRDAAIRTQQFRQQQDVTPSQQPPQSLDSPVSEDPTRAGDPGSGGTDAADVPTISGFRVRRQLSRGGMGTVYEAEWLEGVPSRVAVKTLWRLDSELEQRFLRECDCHVQFDHPSIVRLLKTGRTETGTPFLAMEFVDGKAITAHCDQKHLSIPDRLRLFIKVLESVEFVHSHAIIHRDLKPGNILVTDSGQPKLLDFGIAKAFETSGDAMTEFATQAAHRVGTPGYWSPEQRRGAPAAMSMDVYALGVILFELCTGELPFPPDTADSVVATIASPLSSEIPGRAAADGMCRSRRTTPRQLRRTLRGSLDAILAKALQPDCGVGPGKRYATVTELRMDLAMYLAGMPVQAEKQTALVRFRKFVRRQWRLVATASLFVSVLLAGIAGTAWGLREAQQSATALRVQVDETFTAYDEYVDVVMSDDVLKSVQFQPLRQSLLNQAKSYYRLRSQKNASGDGGGWFAWQQTSLDEERRVLRALERLAQIQEETVSPSQALESLIAAHHLGARLLERHPDNPEFRKGVIRIQSHLGLVQVRAGDRDSGIETCRRARAAADAWLNERPTTEAQLQRVAAQRTLMQAMYRCAEGDRYHEFMERALHEAIEWKRLAAEAFKAHPSAENQFELAWATNGHALTMHKNRLPRAPSQTDEAYEAARGDRARHILRTYDDASTLVRELSESEPDEEKYLRLQAAILSNKGMTLTSRKLSRDAIDAQRQALSLRRKIAENNPLVLEDQRSLAIACGNLADAYFHFSLTEREQEIEPRRCAIRVLEDAVKLAPDVEMLRQMHSLHSLRLANLLHQTDRDAESIEVLRASLAIHPTPETAEAQNHHTLMHAALAFVILMAVEEDPQKRQDFEDRAVRLLKEVGDNSPPESPLLVRIRTDPAFQRLRHRPEVKRLITSGKTSE